MKHRIIRDLFFLTFLWLLLVLPQPSFCNALSPKDKPFDNSSFVVINGVKLHYRLWLAEDKSDSLPWVLLLHGMGGSTYAWRHNTKALNDAGFNVVALDIPPYGYSDKNPSLDFSNNHRVHLIWTLLNYINPFTHWHLIGHSMGGGIAQYMAITQPEKTAKVVFVGGALLGQQTPTDAPLNTLIGSKPVKELMVLAGRIYFIKPKRIEKMLQSAFGTNVSSKDVKSYYEALSVKGTARAIVNSLTASANQSAIDGLSFNKTSLCIWGKNDTWVPYRLYKDLVDKFPLNETFIIENAAHCPMETHYQIFNKKVCSFLLHNK